MRKSSATSFAIGLVLFCAQLSMAQTNLAALQSAPGALPEAQGTAPQGPRQSGTQLAQAAQTVAPNATDPGSSEPLTRQRGEQLALKNNPRIRVAALLALAQRQVVRETRSAELPNLNGNLTAVDAEEASRISSGTLNASRLLYHAGAGVVLNQLITDFGRTRNLVASSSLQAKASEDSSLATRADIALATDLAFYRALEMQATLAVAQSTVNARQTVSDQVSALTANKLKSALDQSFAEVNLSQAKLLALDAQSQYDTAVAALNEVLGTTGSTQFHLVDDDAPPAPIATSLDDVITMALRRRPDLLALRDMHNADVRFAQAQHDQLLPTISGLGIVGITPIGSNQYFPQNWYGAAGINIGIPIFNGFRYHAEATEADLRAKAAAEKARDLEDRIVRDVRTTWLTMATAQQRMSVTAELLKEANTALDLAQTRYNLGLSSIVELSQAQLQQTEAQIDDANARFDYEADLAALRYQGGSTP